MNLCFPKLGRKCLKLDAQLVEALIVPKLGRELLLQYKIEHQNVCGVFASET